MGSMGMGHSSAASESPSKALDSGKLDTSLTNALEKSGISVPGGNLKSACSGFKNLGSALQPCRLPRTLAFRAGSRIEGKDDRNEFCQPRQSHSGTESERECEG
jgi:hypothetical protein